MAKKEKDKKKADSKSGRRAAAPADGTGQANSRDEDMRRIAREAAWARMFGKNDTKNPFAGRT
jgi:hypothetical protein